MASEDFLNYTLAIGALIIIVSFSYASYRIAETFRAVKSITDRLEGRAIGIRSIKDRIKFEILDTIGSIISKFLKGGDTNERHQEKWTNT